ncbi:MAG: DNA cytosine methyltransferase [bacterium]
MRKLNINSLSPIDIFAYGFPCNDFSIVGEQKGFKGNFGPLYSYGVEVLNKFKPKVFIAENVGGIASANGGEAFKK